MVSGVTTVAACVHPPDDVEGPVQHGCPTRDDCAYCHGTVPPGDGFDWSFLDAVYCISLKHRVDRVESVCDEFHRVGLCRQVVFYRPAKHPVKGLIGSWESHRAVGMLALERGARSTLVFEDDVQFVRGLTPRRVQAARVALGQLPEDWHIFFLGHWPLWSYFVRRNVLRTASACSHAYIASPRLLAWLRDHPHSTRDQLELFTLAGHQLDAAYACLPGTYALFPMIATQRVSPSDNFPMARGPKKRFKHLVSRSRARDWLLSRLMRPAEAVVVSYAPVTWLVQRLKGRRRAG